MKITNREIIVSIAITAVMFIIGFFISDIISDDVNDRNAEYQKAAHIENRELFQYGMDTNLGNAFVYGDLEAVDTVTFDKIGGEYMYVEKIEEHYNRHTRTVTKTRTVNGKTQTYTDTVVYYSWDYYDSWEKHSNKIKFCDIEFEYGKIDHPSSQYIDTVGGGFLSKVRYKYYGTPIKHAGTIYTKLSDGTISDNSRFFEDYTIDEALDKCTAANETVLFWFVWIILIGGCVAGFYYFDNNWLQD